MKVFLFALFLLILPTVKVYAAEIYKCKVNGQIVFTDKKCDGELVELKKKNSVSSDSAGGLYNSSTWYNNYSGYQSALAVSKKENVAIFLYFQADWCGYCRKLERELIGTDRGELALRRVIKVRISPEDGTKEMTLFKELGGTGYPSVYLQKQFDKRPSKVSFMAKRNGKWQTKSADYLEGLIESITAKTK